MLVANLARRYGAILFVIVGPYRFHVTKESFFDVFLAPARKWVTFLKCSSKLLGRYFVPSRPHRTTDVNPQFAYLITGAPLPGFIEVLDFIRKRWFRDERIAVGPAQHQQRVSSDVGL